MSSESRPGNYEAFHLVDGVWRSIGRFAERKRAIKLAKKDGIVVFHAAPRVFLSYSHYLMPRKTIDLLRNEPGFEELTI